MSTLFDIEQGATATRTITIEDDSGAAVTSLTEVNPLAAEVSVGGGRAPAFAPALAWLDPLKGTVTLTLSGDDTGALTPGLYRLRCRVWIESGWIYFCDGIFRVTGGTGGAGTEPRCYCTMTDVRRWASWIDLLLASEDLGLSLDLAEYRHRATTRLDEILIQCYRPNDRRGEGTRGYSLGDPGSGSWATMQNYGNWTWIREQLEAGALMLTGDRGDRAREITARWTIAYVCGDQIGEGPQKTSYQDLAARYLATANNRLVGYVAELDLNADGFPDLWIDCGRRSVR